MRTPKQTAASRANGSLSKGPVSIQGKLNSSRNSLRHGLLARTVVLEEESTPRFLELLRALIEEFRPASATQLMLVETMAVARWRQLRIWGLQKVALDREIALQDPALGTPEVRAALAFKPSSDSLQPELTLRYDVALDRQFSRALARLLDLQSRPAPKTSTPYFPDSLPGTTWPASPQRRGDDPPSVSSSGSDPGLAVLRASENQPQRREPTPQGVGPAGGGSGLAVLRASKDSCELVRPGFAAKSLPAKRTQQPVDSTHPPHPAAGEPVNGYGIPPRASELSLPLPARAPRRAEAPRAARLRSLPVDGRRPWPAPRLGHRQGCEPILEFPSPARSAVQTSCSRHPEPARRHSISAPNSPSYAVILPSFP